MLYPAYNVNFLYNNLSFAFCPYAQMLLISQGHYHSKKKSRIDAVRDLQLTRTTQHPRGHVLYNISHDPDLAGYDVDPIV
eukprot:g17481.t1